MLMYWGVVYIELFNDFIDTGYRRRIKYCRLLKSTIFMDLSNKLNPEELESQEYKFGWTTDIESESAPPGLNEEVIRWISSKKI